MLRISALNEQEITRLKLEGKLAHEWVAELRRAWATIVEIDGAQIVIDLRGVSFVDESGHQLLAAMRHSGATLIGGGPLMSALIKEIEDAETARAHGNGRALAKSGKKEKLQG
jgi:anti-anti-sigma regulatory factor